MGVDDWDFNYRWNCRVGGSIFLLRLLHVLLFTKTQTSKVGNMGDEAQKWLHLVLVSMVFIHALWSSVVGECISDSVSWDTQSWRCHGDQPSALGLQCF